MHFMPCNSLVQARNSQNNCPSLQPQGQLLFQELPGPQASAYTPNITSCQLGGTFHRRLGLLLAMGKKRTSLSFHNLDNQNHATCETDDIRINKRRALYFCC
jgi:hypothetical protein